MIAHVATLEGIIEFVPFKREERGWAGAKNSVSSYWNGPWKMSP